MVIVLLMPKKMLKSTAKKGPGLKTTTSFGPLTSIRLVLAILLISGEKP